MIERPIVGGLEGCLHRNNGIGVVVFANGTRHYANVCFDCDGRSAEWYSKRELLAAGVDLDGLDVVEDNRIREPCQVCGSTAGIEEHHWAPQSLDDWFVDPASWPTSYLCRTCHAEWHRIVTPELVKPTTTLQELRARRSTTLRELGDQARVLLRPKEDAA